MFLGFMFFCFFHFWIWGIPEKIREYRNKRTKPKTCEQTPKNMFQFFAFGGLFVKLAVKDYLRTYRRTADAAMKKNGFNILSNNCTSNETVQGTI